LEMANFVYTVSEGNFDNKKCSIAILICTCKSCMITLLLYISESESRLTKEGPNA